MESRLDSGGVTMSSTPMSVNSSRRAFLTAVAQGGGGLAALSWLAACGIDGGGDRDHRQLRSAVRGTVLMAGDNGFEQACRPWNLAVKQHVLAVVEIADAADAAGVVRYANAAGVSVSVQPNGHGASGNLTGDVILVRTRRLDFVRVDPGTRSARVGAGVSWAQVLTAAEPHNLIGMAGSSPAVSVVGYTLGGGSSWFGRAHGWASDAVTAFEIIDADGNPKRITRNSDPDMFWVLRGGGGDFALVTAIEFDLYPAPALYGGRMLWPAEHAPEVLDAFREITARAPDELTVWYQRLQFPGAPAMVGIDSTYLGDAARGQDLLRAFDRIGGRLNDSRRVLPIGAIGDITGEPATPHAGFSHTELLTHLDDRVAAALLEPIEPLFNVQLRHLGGALSRQSDSAAGTLTELYGLVYSGAAPTQPSDIGKRIQRYRQTLGPYLGSRIPFTFLAPGDTAARAFSPATLSRLRKIKRDRDHRNIFTSNFPISA